MTNVSSINSTLATILGALIAPRSDMDSGDIGSFDLVGDLDGLRVVIRRGYGADASRLTITGSYTPALRGDLDYREMPDFHSLETRQAMSKSPDIIAREITRKIIEPAKPMLEAFRAKRAEVASHLARLEQQASEYRRMFPLAKVTFSRDNRQVDFDWSETVGTDYAYLRGRINADGGFSIDRTGTISKLRVVDALSAIMGKKALLTDEDQRAALFKRIPAVSGFLATALEDLQNNLNEEGRDIDCGTIYSCPIEMVDFAMAEYQTFAAACFARNLDKSDSYIAFREWRAAHLTDEHTGSDLYLERAGHGAGFSDRDFYSDDRDVNMFIGDYLSSAVDHIHTINVDCDDDGRAYFA